MFGVVGEFFSEHIRYNRKEDREIEELWDMMICGHARDRESDSIKNKFLNFVTNIVSIVVAVLGMVFLIMCVVGLFNISAGTSNFAVFLTFFISLIIFPIIANVILRYTVRRVWLRLLLSVAIAFVIGLLLGLISLPFLI